MAQENTNTDDKNNKAPAANSSNSMSSGSGSDLIGAGTIDKGKGVVKEEEQEEGGGSKGKMMSTAQVVAARAGGRRRSDGRALHIATERERRRRMSDMFSKLHGLLPSLPDKMDKSTIVMEAIHYIKTLEGTLSELEKRKQDLARGIPGIGNSGNSGISSSSSAVSAAVVAQQPLVGGILPTGAAAVPPAGAAVAAVPVDLETWSGQHVVLSLLGNDAAYINVCSARRVGRLTTVAAVLEKHGIEVITSGVASDSSRNMFTFHTRRVYNAPNSMFGNDVSTEDIYKLAVSEIMIWLSVAKEDRRTSALFS